MEIFNMTFSVKAISVCLVLYLIAPVHISHALEKKTEDCASPAFWLKDSCWVILNDHEDCLVQPIIMQLEDQPVYCPKEKIKKPPANAKYEKKLAKLKTKNIDEEIKGVIAMHSYYLLGYQIKNKKILPGLKKNQQKHNQCRIVLLDDLDESNHGVAYVKFRQALLDYARHFNQSLIAYCYK